MDDLLDNTTGVTVTLSVIEGSELGRVLQSSERDRQYGRGDDVRARRVVSLVGGSNMPSSAWCWQLLKEQKSAA